MSDDEAVELITDFVDSVLENEARYPTPEEIVANTGVSAEQAAEVLRAIREDDDYAHTPYGVDEDDEDVPVALIKAKLLAIGATTDVDTAAQIVANWYNAEGEFRYTIEQMDTREFKDDICALLDAASNRDEYVTVATAIGEDIFDED